MARHLRNFTAFNGSIPANIPNFYLNNNNTEQAANMHVLITIIYYVIF